MIQLPMTYNGVPVYKMDNMCCGDTRYGYCYVGSKSKIAEQIIHLLPAGEVLYDCFGGGGAITHAACLSKKYNKVVYNELSKLIFDLIDKTHKGEFPTYNFVNRADWYATKDTDPFAKWLCSFNGKGSTYMYADYISRLKDLQNDILNGDADLRAEYLRLYFMEVVNIIKKLLDDNSKERLAKYIRGELDNRLYEYIDKYVDIRIQKNIQDTRRVHADLQRTPLECVNGSYQALDVQAGSVVYCDPPYKGEIEYKGSEGFDHAALWDWCVDLVDNKGCRVFVSEYNVDHPRAKVIAEFLKTRPMSKDNKYTDTREKLFEFV